MKVRIDVVNFGRVVSIRIGGADAEEVRRLLGGSETIGRGARRRASSSSPTSAMIASGVETFVAQGDRARLGAALAEMWRAMERVRADGRDQDDEER